MVLKHLVITGHQCGFARDNTKPCQNNLISCWARIPMQQIKTNVKTCFYFSNKSERISYNFVDKMKKWRLQKKEVWRIYNSDC